MKKTTFFGLLLAALALCSTASASILNVRVARTSMTSVTLAWDNDITAAAPRVSFSAGTLSGCLFDQGQTFTGACAASQLVTITGLAPDTVYCFLPYDYVCDALYWEAGQPIEARTSFYDTPTSTFTNSPTASPTRTNSPTRTATRTVTPTFSHSPTKTLTATRTFTRTFTVTSTFTATRTATRTATPTATLTATRTVTTTATPTATRTATRTASPTRTVTPTATPTATRTATRTASPTRTTSPTPTVTRTPIPLAFVKIVELYAGGGSNSLSVYKNDYVVLFNTSGSPVNLAGTSLEVGTAGTSPTTGPILLTGTIPANSYFLVKGVSGGVNGLALPTADFDAGAALSLVNSGRWVAFVNGTSAVNCGSASILDVVGWGNAGCYETAKPGFVASNAYSVQANDDCVDTGNNFADFTVAGTPSPRNTASATHSCP